MPPLRPRGLFVGLSTLDLVFRLQGTPQPNKKHIVAEHGVYAGGPAANAAVTFTALGGDATLVTAIGRHPLATPIKADLEGQGLRLIDLIPDHEGVPALTSVLVSTPGGDRLIVSSAATALPPLPADLADTSMDRYDVAFVDGHLSGPCLQAARLARAAGTPVVIDTGTWKQGLEPLLESVDDAICPEDFSPPNCATPREIFALLEARGAGRRAMTRGEKPILHPDGADIAELPVPSVEAVDTLGAGDIFHGGYAFARARGRGSFREALGFAARVASCSVRFFGTRAWTSHTAELLAEV